MTNDLNGFRPDYEEDEGFKIDNDGLCEWAIKKIRANNAEIERLTQIANGEHEAIDEALDKATANTRRSTEFLTGHLRAYFETVKHKETATQESYKLLSGSLVMKKPSRKMVKDDEKLVAFLKNSNLGEFIKTKEEPRWADFKKELEYVEMDGELKVVYELTGEVVDAVSIEDVPEAFSIKF